MDSEFIQTIIEIVFKGNILFLSPLLIFLMCIIFSEQIIDLLHTAINGTAGGRRSRH